MSFLQEYQAYCDQYGEPARIECLLCDLNAVLRGKWLPGDQYKKLAEGKVRLPFSTYSPNIMGLEVEATGLGIVAGDPDGVVLPISGTLLPVPWAEGNVAQVLIEVHESNGEISQLSPRQQLANTLEKFTADSLHPVAAAELEFYLIEARQSPEAAPAPPSGSPQAQNFDLESMYRFQPVLDEILSTSKSQGLATDTLIAEYGPGQFEVNFHHTNNILVAADTALLFRRIVRCVAAKHGLEATFMAKPYSNYPGNGMHLHVSVVDDGGNNIFDCGTDQDPVGEILKNAVAGTLATMHELQAVFAPHLNSLRRFAPNSFAPTAPEWGCDHRGAAVRIPETSGPGARLEHRISGADVNPYLVIAAILAGMLYGLETKPALPPMLSKDSGNDSSPQSEPLCSDWQQAITNFSQSKFANTVFGEQYHHIYTQVKINEMMALATQLSQVEYKHYLSRF